MQATPPPISSLSPVEPPLSNNVQPRNPDAEGLIAPAALDPRRVPLQGRLDVTPFLAVLTRIARTRATGSLLLRREQVKKIVFIEDGIPRAVKSNLLYECLGRMLVREHVISEELCEMSVTRLKAEKRLQGHILIELGALNERSLEESLIRQFYAKLIDIFSWGQGLFRFRADELPPLQRIAPLNPYVIGMKGARHGIPAERISIDLSPHMNLIPVLLVTRAELHALEFTDEEREWVRMLDGRRTLGSIISVTGGVEPAYRLFYGLICLGLLAFRPRASMG